MKVAPSILTANFIDLRKDIESIEKDADLLHVDIMDAILYQIFHLDLV